MISNFQKIQENMQTSIQNTQKKYKLISSADKREILNYFGPTKRKLSSQSKLSNVYAGIYQQNSGRYRQLDPI